MTLEKISRSCGPCFETVRCAQPIPAQQTEIRSVAGLGGRCDGRLELLGLEHVGLDEAGSVAELVRERLALLGVEVGDHHRGAVGVQAPGGRLAEARGAADDERACSVDLHRAPSLPRYARAHG